MKLGYLYLEDYKNLKRVKVNFSNSNTTVLLGTNGSGKSNVIEALSKVFEDRFVNLLGDAPDQYENFEYICEYFVDGDVETACCEFLNKQVDSSGDLIAFSESKFSENQKFPHQIICLYSGEESRLWDKYYSALYKKYIECLKSNTLKQQQMLYVNHYHWAISMILLNIYKPDEYKKLGFPAISSVDFHFSNKEIKNYKENEVISLMKSLGYNKSGKVSFTHDILKNTFESQYVAQDIFNYLVLAVLPKEDKLIENIDIHLSGDFTFKELSEGEKKMITLSAIYELLVDNETLVLLDEPDTYVHEGKKQFIFDIVNKYANDGVCTVLTTHSPTLAKCFEPECIRMLESNEGRCSIQNGDLAANIKTLTNGEWNYIDHTIFLDKNRPLLLVEGSGDVEYIRKAINLFAREEEKYIKLLNVDMLHAGGASNMKWFIDEIRKCLPVDKQVIVIFDRDSAGGDGLNSIIKKTSKSKKGQQLEDHNTYQKEQFICFKLPRTPEYLNSEFVIEDYFSKSYKKDLAQAFLDNVDGTFNNLPNDLKKAVKERLSKDIEKYDVSSMAGFRILLDKLISIIDGTETIVQA